MNIYSSKLGALQKPHFWKTLSLGTWFNTILRRNILGTAAETQSIKRDIVQRTSFQFGHYNQHHDYAYNKPVTALWFLNKFETRLTTGASKYEVADLQAARQHLEDYQRLYTLMEYISHICETATLIMNRELTNDASNPLNIYRSSSHNQIESLLPELESTIEAYYDVLDQLEGHPEWRDKIEVEAGAQIAFLATSMDETSRDYLVERSEAFARFDQDKHKFFK